MALNRNVPYIHSATVGDTTSTNDGVNPSNHALASITRTAPGVNDTAELGTLDRGAASTPIPRTEQLEARETALEADAPFTEKNVEMALRELSDDIDRENLWDRDGTTLEPHNAGDGIEVGDITGTGDANITGSLTAGDARVGGAGAIVDEFSTDGTLAGDSDTALPTEQAVKTYVDTELAAKDHGTLLGLQDDDHDNVYDRVVGRDGSIATKAALDIAYPAGVAYRGWTALVIGGAGARDREYRCMKGDGGGYLWVEIGNGGL